MNGMPMSYPNQMYTQNPYMTNQYMNTLGRTSNLYPSYPQNNGITWVQGIEGAKAYQLTPNSNVLLMDSDNDGVFYIKVSDNVGMCNLRTFSYVETTNQPQPTQQSQIDMSKYVTHDELQETLKNIGGIINGKSTVSANDGKQVITE
jgi:hypothetical protein